MRLFRQRGCTIGTKVFKRMADEQGRRATRQGSYGADRGGELLDKITVLEIKAERLSDPTKLHNVHRNWVLCGRPAIGS